jgi:hypothetical protein
MAPPMLPGMREGEQLPDDSDAFGATEQPAVAASMGPQLAMAVGGAGCALVAVLAASIALTVFPAFTSDTGHNWAVAAVVAAVAMLAVGIIQVLTWRRALRSWRGERLQDLHREARLSWIAHVLSYPITLVAVLASVGGSAEAGWSAWSGVLLAVSLFFVIGAEVLAGVQYLRSGGPPGTLPAHIRRLVERSRQREDELDD